MAFKAFNKWGLQSFQQVRASKLSTSERASYSLPKNFNSRQQTNKQTNKQKKVPSV
jgi:hypothetical protein